MLNGLGLDCRAERPGTRARPDIKCFYRGLRIGIEASYSAADTEKDASRRLSQGLVDIAIAPHIKGKVPDMPRGRRL